MPRKTSRYALDTFLRQLARTGNFALSADRAGLAKSGLYKRKARDAAFSAAVARAQAEGLRSNRDLVSKRATGPADDPQGGVDRRHGIHSRDGQPYLTIPGDLVLTRGQSRPAQIRRSPAGRLTDAGIAAFLRNLAQTANIRLSANSIGVAHSSIYRRRQADPDFARAMREALRIGYGRVEAALLESAYRGLDPDPECEQWLEANGGGPMEPMTFDQAFMLYTLHRRQTRDGWEGFRQPEGRIASEEEVERALKRALRRMG